MVEKLTREQLNSILIEYISNLKQKVSIDKAVLFGSYAKGNADPDSDIDLLVVSPDLSPRSPKGYNGFILNQLVGSVNPYLEVIGVNPSVLNRPTTKKFFDSILKTGIEIAL